MTAAIALAIILAVGLVGATGAVGVLGYKVGTLRGDLTVAREASRQAIEAASLAEEAANERGRRSSEVIEQLKAKTRSLRDDLFSHPDPGVRASHAFDSILGMLSEAEGEDDADPDNDNDAGEVSPG